MMALIKYSIILVMSGALLVDKNKYKNPDANQMLGTPSPNPGGVVKIYRYSRLTMLAFSIASLGFSMGILTFNDPSAPTATPDYIIDFFLSTIFLLLAIQNKISCIEIGQEEITINGFLVRRFLISDTAKIHYGRYRGGWGADITLKNGKVYEIVGAPKNHYQLAETLNACVGKGRWTSSDWWTTRYFKKSASRSISKKDR